MYGVETGFGAHPSSYLMGARDSFLVLNRLVHEGDHSHVMLRLVFCLFI